MIQTERLSLVPLTIKQLETALASVSQLSETMGFSIVAEMMRGNTESAIKKKLAKMQGVREDFHPWYTYWLIVVRDQNTGAGVVGFKGVPDDLGAVEVGYRMAEAYRGHGYMTEAVQALVDWGFSHDNCLRVTATHVLVENHASQRVLSRAGFRQIGSDESGVNFIKERMKNPTVLDE
jgi:ribosomal-protein-alanine N-acetyltransferase